MDQYRQVSAGIGWMAWMAMDQYRQVSAGIGWMAWMAIHSHGPIRPLYFLINPYIFFK